MTKNPADTEEKEKNFLLGKEIKNNNSTFILFYALCLCIFKKYPHHF